MNAACPAGYHRLPDARHFWQCGSACPGIPLTDVRCFCACQRDRLPRYQLPCTDDTRAFKPSEIPDVLVFTHRRDLLTLKATQLTAAERRYAANVRQTIAMHNRSSRKVTTRFLSDADCTRAILQLDDAAVRRTLHAAFAVSYTHLTLPTILLV